MANLISNFRSWRDATLAQFSARVVRRLWPGIHRLTSDLIGPIVGIVNVDAGWNYDAIGLDPRPDVHASDPRIITVIDTVAQASLRLARLLVRSVPSE